MTFSCRIAFAGLALVLGLPAAAQTGAESPPRVPALPAAAIPAAESVAAPASPAPPRSFESAQQAADALIAAVSRHDDVALHEIFGEQADALLTTGDAVQDKAQHEEFAQLAARTHRLVQDGMDARRLILLIGEDDWPFPVPIVPSGKRWIFDTMLGQTVVDARRIGANELDAIEVCAGFVAAQQQYTLRHGGIGYARRLMSTPGVDDGLYSDAQPLVPRMFAEAAMDGFSRDRPRRYHGYYFRVLTAQGPNAPGGAHNYLVHDLLLGGFALVAWPAQYGETGVHTFLVNQDGVVYERNLGPQDDPQSAPVGTFDPEPGWKPLQ